MKISVSFEFETYEEYLAFNARIASLLSEQPSSKPSKPKVNKSPSKTSQVANPALPSITGFKPPSEMIDKVQQCIVNQQHFRTADVAGKSIMNNPNRRAKANQWLQKHPDLAFDYVKTPGQGGKGALTYAPVQYVNGRAILPTFQSPSKTDWPIKGATAKKGYKPPFDSTFEDDDLSDLFPSETAETPSKQAV